MPIYEYRCAKCGFQKEYLQRLNSGPFVTPMQAGNVDAALAGATRVVTLDYENPFLAHATLEPMNCVADVTAARCRIFAPTQGQELATYALSAALGLRPEQIDVAIHPQSTIHSMVEFVDSSVLAQLGPTDMRMPIQYALTYPERVASNQVALDWDKLKRLDFEKASTRRFPCLRLAREALKKGGAMPCALNAADEVAVAAFLEHRLPFPGIAEVIERVLGRMPRIKLEKMDDVLKADAEARRMAKEEATQVRSAAAVHVRSA